MNGNEELNWMNAYIKYHQNNYFTYMNQIQQLEQELEDDKKMLNQMIFAQKNPNKECKQKIKPDNSKVRGNSLTHVGPILVPGQLFGTAENFTFRNMVLAPKQTRRVGLFSSRTPHRPNPIGQSIGFVKEMVENNIYLVSGLDLLNNTPVISLTKYQPHFDISDAKGGWMQDQAEQNQLLPLFYDKDDDAATFGEKFEQKYNITNYQDFKQQFEFIQEKVNLNVESYIKNKLERVPVLTRTHKVVEKQQHLVVAIGVFRVYYEMQNQQNIVIKMVKPSLTIEEITNTKEFDPESQICAAFIQKFG